MRHVLVNTILDVYAGGNCVHTMCVRAFSVMFHTACTAETEYFTYSFLEVVRKESVQDWIHAGVQAIKTYRYVYEGLNVNVSPEVHQHTDEPEREPAHGEEYDNNDDHDGDTSL